MLVLRADARIFRRDCRQFRAYGRYIRPLDIALASAASIIRQKRTLARGVEVLVATPGRLLDLVNQRALRLDQVEVLVLDEADRMLDMGSSPTSAASSLC